MMMKVSKGALVVGLCLAMPGMSAIAAPQSGEATGMESGPPAMNLSLQDAVAMALENNLDIKAARITPDLRSQDIIFQEAAFDPNVGASVFKSDNSRPSQNVFDIGTTGTVVSIDSTVNQYDVGWGDSLRYGARYTADLSLQRFTSTSANAIFPTTYYATLTFAYNQSLLRNFGRKANETQIVIAQTNHEISRSQFRNQVLTVLQSAEDAYWELVFAKRDLDVKMESLGLAQELLKLNRIKVQVGTLPPIEITQAEAEVANREQEVIVAENNVSNAEDTLRRVLNMPKADDAWSRAIMPMDQPDYQERAIDLDSEMEEAIENRPDLEQARLSISNADTQLTYDRNQLKWDLGFQATYRLDGLAGDQVDPNTMSLLSNQNILDALYYVRDRDFESWSVALALNVPIGNNAAEATYVGSRLAKEQREIDYENARLAAEVDVRTAARAIQTDKKRIDAAEKNVELQRKKVEAEQKKFENGMSTSFQVLTYQEDLTTALGTKNRALVDYRKSLTALERAKGTLDRYLSVTLQ